VKQKAVTGILSFVISESMRDARDEGTGSATDGLGQGVVECDATAVER
jgi:hypothetical protein